jgi:hypothetical protein
VAFERREADPGDDVRDNPSPFTACDVSHPQAKIDILTYRLPRKEGWLLKHDPAVGSGRQNWLAAHSQSPGLRTLKSSDAADEARLAAPGRAEDRYEFSRGNRERELLDGDHGPSACAERKADILDLDGPRVHDLPTR